MGTGKTDPNRMSFLEHLDELRRRLLRCCAVLVLGILVMWPVSGYLYDFLVIPVKQSLPEGTNLAYTEISDPFILYTKISLFGALFLAIPYILIEFWLFVSPGLYRKEKRGVIPFVLAATILFFMGGAFAYKVIVPFACSYFIGLGEEANFQPVITVKGVLTFVLQLILATGGVFQLPVIVYFLTRIGLLTPAFLWHYFGHAFFLIWLLAAVITPPDVFSMVLVGIPMTLLYLIGILVSWAFQPRREP